MRTNIDIDDDLMKLAMKATGAKTKRAAVETALRQAVQFKKQERIRRWFGKVQWEGDLAVMREGRLMNRQHGRKEAVGEKAIVGRSVPLKTAAR